MPSTPVKIVTNSPSDPVRLVGAENIPAGYIPVSDGSGGIQWIDSSGFGGGGGFPEITVTSDWTVAANAWADIKASLGVSERELTISYSYEYNQFYFWEGEGDPDDYACLTQDTLHSSIAWGKGFNTSPSSGTVKLIAIVVEGQMQF